MGQIGQCNCYETRLEPMETNPKLRRIYGVCLGTKEIDRCGCDGDESKCDFYPEKRKAAKKMLNTAEMWLKAQEDGKTYIVKQKTLAYSKERGLFYVTDLTSYNYLKDFKNWKFDQLLSLEWTEMSETIMTKAEAEKKFGIRIMD